MEHDVLLKIEDLTIHYETDEDIVSAVNHLDLQLNRGETLGLVGETGAGKTTTALGIMKLLPDPPARIMSGKIFFEDEDRVPFPRRRSPASIFRTRTSMAI